MAIIWTVTDKTGGVYFMNPFYRIDVPMLSFNLDQKFRISLFLQNVRMEYCIKETLLLSVVFDIIHNIPYTTMKSSSLVQHLELNLEALSHP